MRRGSAGRVDVGHHHTYEVVTAGGRRVTAGRDQLAIKKHEVALHLVGRAADFDELSGSIAFRAVVGSTAWGLADDGSDVDVRGFFVLPFELRASLYAQPDTIDDPTTDASFWEVEKLLHLLLRSDAGAIELLWSPIVLQSSPIADAIRGVRHRFPSNNVVGSFGRYALSQMKKIERRLEQGRRGADIADALAAGVTDRPGLARHLAGRWSPDRGPAGVEAADAAIGSFLDSLVDRGLLPDRRLDGLVRLLETDPRTTLLADGPYRPKNAYNLIRLLHSGIRLVTTGEPLIAIEDPLALRLRAIKDGSVPIDEVVAEARRLGAELEAAAARSVLPDEPPFALADDLLRRARREAARVPRRPSPTGRPATGDLPGALADRVAAAIGDGLVQLALVGAHAYGFPSPDSDLDLKGIHQVPTRRLLGLTAPGSTRDATDVVEGVEVDWTTHEVGFALGLLLRGNGNVLERLLAPVQLVAGPVPDLLARLAAGSIGTHFAGHYRGFLAQLRGRLEAGQGSVKTLLYAHRVALTGAHLFRTGRLVLDVGQLAPDDAAVEDLVAAKAAGGEATALDRPVDPATLDRLAARLEDAIAGSPLPAGAPNADRIERALVALRLRRL